MHAGVLTFRVAPGKIEEAVLIYWVPWCRRCGSNEGSGGISCPRIPRSTRATPSTSGKRKKTPRHTRAAGLTESRSLSSGTRSPSHPPERSTRSASRCRRERGEGEAGAADGSDRYLCSRPSVQDVRPDGCSLQSYDLVPRADKAAFDDSGADAAALSLQGARHAGLGNVLDVLAGRTGPVVL